MLGIEEEYYCVDDILAVSVYTHSDKKHDNTRATAMLREDVFIGNFRVQSDLLS